MTSGDLTPQKAQHSKLWWEIRITAGGLALLAMFIGGYQLWEIALKPLSANVVIGGEADPSFDGESTAEWLVRRLDFDVHLTETNADLLSLPAGTLAGTLRVKGHHQRREVEDGSVVAVGRLPGAEHPDLELTLRSTLASDGSLQFTLPLDQAEAYCRRSIGTYVVIRDQREAVVRGLTSVGRIPIAERRGEAGTYDLQVPLENLIFVLEGDGRYPVEVRTPDGSQSTLTVPGEWFLREGQRSRVLTLDRPQPAATPGTLVREEPVAKPAPVPPSGAQEVPEVDATQQRRQARLAELEQDITGAIGRRQWDRAQAHIDELAEMEGPTARIRQFREAVRSGRVEEENQRRLKQAADAVGAALLAKNWDQAEAAMNHVRELAPQDERIATWQQVIDEGRADEVSEAVAPAEDTLDDAPLPAPIEPPIDEEPLVRRTLARYVESQNTLDWNLFVAVVPSMSANRQQIQRAWDGYRSQTVTLDVQSIQLFGDTAVARCYRAVTVEPKVGGAQRNEGRYEFALSKSSGAWIIERITPLP